MITGSISVAYNPGTYLGNAYKKIPVTSVTVQGITSLYVIALMVTKKWRKDSP